MRRVLTAHDGEAIPLDPSLDRPLHRLQEVVAVELRVEADEVGAEHAEQDLLLPGTDADGLEVRPRDVPEERDARVGPGLFHQPRQQREVIVLHEHDGLLDGLHLLQQRLREALVHQAVVPPVGGAKARALVDDVAERPQALVGETVIVAGLLLVAQPHAPQGVRRIRRGQPDPLADLTVGVAAAVGDPHAAARLHDRAERGHEAARRLLLPHEAAVAHVAHRLAVGHDEDGTAAEAHLDELLETLLRPYALAGQPQPRLLLGGAAGARERPRQARHLGGERAEEALVGVGRRRHRAAGLHLLGPLRNPGDRAGHRPAYERPRDARDEQHQDAHAHRRPPP